ncbi:MAG: hypothetical protein PVG86_07470 [Desulfobacterales bacterium]
MNIQSDMILFESDEKFVEIEYTFKKLCGQSCQVAIVTIPEGEGILWDAIDVCRALQVSDPERAVEGLEENVDKVLMMDEDYIGCWFIHESCFNKLQPEFDKLFTT